MYIFEPTRSADHLREYLNNLSIYLVSDAYAAYYTIEKESGGRIIVAVCWMHMRRKFAEAYIAMKPELEKLSDDEFREHPVVKGFLLANEIFLADTPLKKLTAEQRLERRNEEVRPHVEKYFAFIHELDAGDQPLEGKLGEAVTYALNQEEHLKVFLENGSIPIDNGESERCFKSVALGRRNSLFSYSVSGAECNAILYSIVETAKANGADVYTYLYYLLTAIRSEIKYKDPDLRKDAMPWSPRYREFERQRLASHADEKIPESNTPPNTVRFRIRSKTGAVC